MRVCAQKEVAGTLAIPSLHRLPACQVRLGLETSLAELWGPFESIAIQSSVALLVRLNLTALAPSLGGRDVLTLSSIARGFLVFLCPLQAV
jgi:hypothetical protein